MISSRQGIAKIIAIMLAVLSFLLLIAYIWAGYSIDHLNPLTNITNQRAEEILSQALGQKVQIGRISDLSFNRLVLEDIRSGEYLPGTGKSEIPLSFHIPRVIIRLDIWGYLLDGQMSSIAVHLHQPEIKLYGPIKSPGLNTYAESWPTDLGDLQIQTAISKGKLVYADATVREAISVGSIEGKLAFGSEHGKQQLRMTSLEFSWGPSFLRLQGLITAGEGKEGQANVDLVVTTRDKSNLSIVGSVQPGLSPKCDLSLKAERVSLQELVSFTEVWSSTFGALATENSKSTNSVAQSRASTVMNDIIGQSLGGTINGTVNGHWRLYGQISELRVEGEFNVSRIDYGGVSLGEVVGEMETDGESLKFYDIEAGLLGGTVTGHGILALGQDPTYDFQLSVQGIKPTKIAILTKAWQLELSQVAMEILPELKAEIRISPGAMGPQWEADWQTRWQGKDILGQAALNPDGKYTVEGQCEGILLSELLRQVPSGGQGVPITGTVDVSATALGSFGQGPKGRVKAHVQGLMIDGISLGQARIEGELDGKQFIISQAKWDTGSGSAALGGSISWGEVWDLWIETPKLEIQRLPWVAKMMQDLKGTVAISGTWRGPWGQPVLSAQLHGEDLTWAAPGLPGTIVIPRVRADMQDSRVDLAPFDVNYGDGTITVMGTVLLEGLDHLSLDLKGKVRKVWYDSGAFTGRLSGEISLAGIWPTPHLAGQLRLYQGRLDLARLGQTTIPTVDIPLAIELEIDESLAITGAGLLDVVAGGVIHINGSTSIPRVRGRIDVVRGQLVYFGTPFQIVRGWAEFRPYQELIPDIYLEGSGKVKDLPVTLVLQGPGTNMEPTLQSEQGFSERELLAMLSIPEKVNTVLDDGLGQVFQREMRELLAGQFKLHVLGSLERCLQEALGLDELELEPGLSDGQVRLELGKYVTKDVFVAYTQTVYPHWENQWHLDYKLNHGLRLSTTWDGDKSYTLGLEVKLDF